MRNFFVRCLFLLVVGLVTPQGSYALGYTYYGSVTPRPSDITPGVPFTVYWRYACVSALDGRALDCPFSHRVMGLKYPVSDPENNGGHQHGFIDRPFILDGKIIEYPQDSDPDPLVVVSSTLASGGPAFVKHEMPEASGTFEVEGILGAPPGWYCVSGCYTDKTWRDVTAYRVAIRDTLVELPAADGVYIRCARTFGCLVDSPGDQYHDNVFYGKPNLIYNLIGMAAVYRSQTGDILRITDMSLFKGGVLDFTANWTEPHKSHRTGNNADISRKSLTNGMENPVKQKKLDKIARNMGLGRLAESSKAECDAYQSGEPPCIHISVP